MIAKFAERVVVSLAVSAQVRERLAGVENLVLVNILEFLDKAQLVSLKMQNLQIGQVGYTLKVDKCIVGNV